MLQELAITPSSIVLIVLILVCVVLAVRRMLKKGLCDCHDGCEGCTGKKIKSCGKGACSRCEAVESMFSNIEASLKPPDK